MPLYDIQSILLTEIDISAQTESVVTIVTATDLQNFDYSKLNGPVTISWRNNFDQIYSREKRTNNN